MKKITLKKDYSIKLKSQITKHFMPQYVYLPIPKEDELFSKIQVKKEEKISKYLVSPVSGKIVGIKYCQNALGEILKCLTILNDYKETYIKRTSIRKNIQQLSLEQIVLELKEYQYHEIAEKLWQQKNAKILILNGIEEEPYVANEIFCNLTNPSIMLEMLDALKEMNTYEEVKIVIKNTDRENIEAYHNFLFSYPNMELLLVPDFYLVSEFLEDYMELKKDYLLLKPSELKIAYNVLKRRHYQTEHLFTISGDGITNPQMIEAKLGSSVTEIMQTYIHFKKEPLKIYINGIMRGRITSLENMIVTPDLQAILIMKESTIEEKLCINCGKCYQVCPKGCNPRAYLENRNKEAIKNCIDCGLCSYICPSFINLRKEMQDEKREE